MPRNKIDLTHEEQKKLRATTREIALLLSLFNDATFHDDLLYVSLILARIKDKKYIKKEDLHNLMTIAHDDCKRMFLNPTPIYIPSHGSQEEKKTLVSMLSTFNTDEINSTHISSLLLERLNYLRIINLKTSEPAHQQLEPTFNITEEQWEAARKFFKENPKKRIMSKKNDPNYYLPSGLADRSKHTFISIAGEPWAVANGIYQGEGGFGLVKKIVNQKGHVLALKIEGKDNKPPAENEIELMQEMGHLKDQFEKEYDSPVFFKQAWINKKLYTAMTFFPGKDLEKLLYYTDEELIKQGNELGYLIPRTEQTLSEKEKAIIALMAAQRVEQLHQKRFIHGDIKAANFVVNIDKDMILVNDADWGLSKRLKEGQSALQMKVAQGTPGYAAPEIYPDAYGFCYYSHASDVYALGVMYRNNLNLPGELYLDMVNDEPESRPPIRAVVKNVADYLLKEFPDLTPRERQLIQQAKAGPLPVEQPKANLIADKPRTAGRVGPVERPFPSTSAPKQAAVGQPHAAQKAAKGRPLPQVPRNTSTAPKAEPVPAVPVVNKGGPVPAASVNKGGPVPAASVNKGGPVPAASLNKGGPVPVTSTHKRSPEVPTKVDRPPLMAANRPPVPAVPPRSAANRPVPVAAGNKPPIMSPPALPPRPAKDGPVPIASGNKAPPAVPPKANRPVLPAANRAVPPLVPPRPNRTVPANRAENKPLADTRPAVPPRSDKGGVVANQPTGNRGAPTRPVPPTPATRNKPALKSALKKGNQLTPGYTQMSTPDKKKKQVRFAPLPDAVKPAKKDVKAGQQVGYSHYVNSNRGTQAKTPEKPAKEEPPLTKPRHLKGK